MKTTLKNVKARAMKLHRTAPVLSPFQMAAWMQGLEKVAREGFDLDNFKTTEQIRKDMEAVVKFS